MCVWGGYIKLFTSFGLMYKYPEVFIINSNRRNNRLSCCDIVIELLRRPDNWSRLIDQIINPESLTYGAAAAAWEADLIFFSYRKGAVQQAF